MLKNELNIGQNESKSGTKRQKRLKAITINGHKISLVGSSEIAELAVREEQNFTSVDEILDNLGLSNPYILLITLCLAFCWGLRIANIMCTVLYGSGLKCNSNDQECIEERWKRFTIKDQFHIHEDSKLSIEWTMTIFFIGDVFGGVFLSILSDKIGRRLIVFPSIILANLLGILSTYTQIYEALLAIRFCEGFFFTSSCLLTWTYVSECVSIKKHSLVLLIFGIFWTTGYCSIAFLSIYVLDWRDATLFICVPTTILATILWLIVPQSFHFLVQHSKANAVKKWLRKADRNSFEVALLTRVIDEDKTVKHGFRQFITFMKYNPSYILYLIACAFIWFINFALYFGMTVYSVNLNGFENYIFSGLVELPAFLISPLLLNGLGRKPTFILIHLLCLCCFAFLAVLNQSNRVLFLAIWLLAKFGVTSTFGYLFVYGSEIFPVIIRNMTMAVCVGFSSLGAAFGSQFQLLGEIHPQLPWIVFSSISAISILCFLVLPETKPTKKNRHSTLYTSISQ